MPPAGCAHRKLPEWPLDNGVPRLFGEDGQERTKHSRTAGPREQHSQRHRGLFSKEKACHLDALRPGEWKATLATLRAQAAGRLGASPPAGA